MGCLKKCGVVRDLIRSSRCDICCLQETKWNQIDFSYVASVLPTFFARNCVSVNAADSKGGMIIAWKRNYALVSNWATKHTCSAVLIQIVTGTKFIITNVYGPSVDNGKLEFLEELLRLKQLIMGPWMLLGDFNVVDG